MAKANVKKDVCIGCGLCANIASDVFTMGDDGIAEVIGGGEIGDELVSSAEDAAASCPVVAIEVEE